MYVIYSERTGLPYIDSKRRSILFDTEEKAEVFVENNGKVYMQEAADGLKHTLSECYAAGAKAMMDAGIVPSESQLEAMGWTPEQYWIYKMAQGY